MQRKKIGLALLALAVVGLFAGGAVYAYFQDYQKVEGNQLTAGTLDLTFGTTPVPVSIDPVYPGWGTTLHPDTVAAATQTIMVTNSGNIDGRLSLTLMDIVNDDNGLTEPEEKYNLVPGDTPDSTGLAGEGELGAYLMFSVDYNGVEVLAPTTLNDAVGEIDLGALAQGASGTVTVHYYVPETVGNVIQSDIVSYSLVLILDQAPA